MDGVLSVVELDEGGKAATGEVGPWTWEYTLGSDTVTFSLGGELFSTFTVEGLREAASLFLWANYWIQYVDRLNGPETMVVTSDDFPLMAGQSKD